MNTNKQPDALLLNVKEVAVVLGCSARTVYRLSDAGKMPRLIKLGVLVKWRRSEIEKWIEQGCPNADTHRE